MPAAEQLDAVRAKLKELNPDFDGKVGDRCEDGKIVEVHFLTDQVTDISPVRALPALTILVCRGSESGKGKLKDLGPLRGMKLEYLDCSANWALADLSPLRGMPLRQLVAWCTGVSNLSPLRGMPLTTLDCSWTFVTDLGALDGLPLKRLLIRTNGAAPDLQPVAGAPLQEIQCVFRAERDTVLLRSIPTLRRINDRPAAEFLKEFGAPPAAKP
jgi:hypothetical protein